MNEHAHWNGLGPSSLIRSRQQHKRSGTDVPGLCALEDYTCLQGESVAMRLLRAQLRRVAPHLRIALITGEEGTGKETVALALHRFVAVSDATFLSQSAASLLTLLPEILARAEASPVQAKEAALKSKLDCHGGKQITREVKAMTESAAAPIYDAQALDYSSCTLFLNDVGDLTFGEQMYLLRALQRIAGLSEAERPRMIFATARDLRTLSGAGRFDRNLYRKISPVEIVLPSLRSRPEDIPLITCGLLSRIARGQSTGAFDGRALTRLQSHDWPGNIRELEYVVDRARQQAGEGVIEPAHLPALAESARVQRHKQFDHRVERLEDVIQGHVLEVLLRCSGNKVRAAERLGISRSTLYRMLDAGAEERAG